jgi:hypothetical protein
MFETTNQWIVGKHQVFGVGAFWPQHGGPYDWDLMGIHQ